MVFQSLKPKNIKKKLNSFVSALDCSGHMDDSIETFVTSVKFMTHWWVAESYAKSDHFWQTLQWDFWAFTRPLLCWFEAFSQLLKGLKIGTAICKTCGHVVIGGDEALIIQRNSLLFRLILLRIGSVLGTFLGFWHHSQYDSMWFLACSQTSSHQVFTPLPMYYQLVPK